MAYPNSMNVKEIKCEGLQAKIAQRAAEQNFKSVLFALVNSLETESLACEVLKTKISTECGKFAKRKSWLNTSSVVNLERERVC